MTKQHHLPEHLPPRLDLRISPSDPRRAKNYDRLVELLEELGRMLDARAVGPDVLRRWEDEVARCLTRGELDMLMTVPEDEAYDVSALPEQRWRNLRRLLFRRKGLPADG